ncbi:Z1 domain-containing protein [Aquimarina sp. 2201CG1-2-11]|uniref:Z1 domain-containing protein n=1 Tax=Aquimarina discodermiae TaxID=3231043 RepID=UPI0034631324
MSEDNILEQAQKICRNLLELDLPITSEKISEAIKKVRQILPIINDTDEIILHERLIAVTGTTQEAAKILDDNKTEPWILDKWAENPTQRKFWRRYRDYLTDEKKFPHKVVSRLDELTDNILDRLADPNVYDQFDKRGLIVGHVQSGKTSNYIGLINKAADAGYKLIIVLAGIHNSLRSQTQLRIDEGFLGYDTETSRSFTQSSNRIGVGKIDRYVAAHSLTSNAPNGDFRKNIAETVNINLKGSDPVVLVIKKNNSVLKNLIEWLSGKEGEDYGDGERIIKNIPLLLIDDEADNASINISKSSVSAINGAIRAVLNLFDKSAYVGYTATPYANVFIPTPDNKEEVLRKGIKIIAGNQNYTIGNDLFPRNFIINIPPPSNYIGPDRIFGLVREDVLYENDEASNDTISPLNLYEQIDDYQPKEYLDNKHLVNKLRKDNYNYIPDKHKKDDDKPVELPQSLKKAIKYFILSCAARRTRGQINVDNSMLIHVTRFVDWQNHIALKVGEELSKYKRQIEFNQVDFIEGLKELWEKRFLPKTNEIIKHLEIEGNTDPDIKPINWNEIKNQLLPAVTKIQLRAVHGSKLLGGLEVKNIEPLDYYDHKKGLSVIAVGGNKLSRGLTLEGLTVSYYLRSSKMYDTLMQMGRWFGYRPGYLDLCRLFTSNDLISNYKHISIATEEMRAEFDRMVFLNKQPIDYGLKVRSHTGLLSITAANKFRYRKMMSFSFSGGLEETWEFDISKKRRHMFKDNHLLTQSLIESLGEPTGPKNNSSHLRTQNFVWQGDNNFQTVINYLDRYKTTQQSFHTGLLIDYINNQVKKKKLINWTIALINNSRTDKIVKGYGNLDVGLSFRKNDTENISGNYALVKSHIIGNFHEYIDLTDDQLYKAFEQTKLDKESEGKDPDKVIHPSPLRIRINRPDTNGLLLIYPLDPNPEKSESPFSNVPIIGLAISFPYINKDEKVVYAINEVFQKELYDYPDEYDTEDFIEDEADDSKNTGSIFRNLSNDTFIDLIEADNSLASYLDDTEFHSGIVPNYYKADSDITDLRTSSNVVLSRTEKYNKNFNSIPYFSENEIQRYFLKEESENIVLNPYENDIVSGEYIIGMKKSRYVIFSYNNNKALFSDALWILNSKRYNTKYMVSLFNSTLFGAWVRVNGQQKKDSYFITEKVIKSFPIHEPLEKDLWLFENLHDLLVCTNNIKSGTMQSYYANILDALIFSIYFNDTLKTDNQKLHSELYKIIPQELPKQIERKQLAKDIFNELYDKSNIVRKVLFYLDDHNLVSKIKSVFTQSN